MPKIANSAWLGSDNTRMWVFTNTQEKEDVDAVPQITSSKGFWICREGAAEPVFCKKAPEIKLKRLCSEVWIEGPRSVAEKIQSVMKQIASFDAGTPFVRKKFTPKTVGRVLKGVPGKRYTVKDVVTFSGCTRNFNNTHLGNMDEEVFIDFGKVDFGRKGAKTIVVNVTVHPSCAGETLDIFSQEQGKNSKRRKVGTLKLPSTGGWRHFKNIPVKLNKVLTGKQNILFNIHGNRASCNFAGWKYLEK